MILILNNHLRQSINRLLRKRVKAGAGVAIIMLLVLLILLVMMDFTFRKNLLQFNYEYIDNSVTSSLLGGSLVNLRELGRGGSLIIQESMDCSVTDSYVLHSYNSFKDIIKYNLKIDDDFNLNGRPGLTGKFEINEYRVYNYWILDNGGFKVIQFNVNKEGFVNVIQYPDNEPVYVETTDGTRVIEQTCVYADVEFSLRLMGYTEVLCSFDENSVVVRKHLRRLVGVRR